MTKLTNAQRELLIRTADAADGLNAPADAKATIAALIKRGLMIAITDEGEGAPRRLKITQAGQSALTPDAPAALPDAPAAPKTRMPKGKLAAVIALLKRPEGAGLDELMTATGWQA